ncbi:hypothetical protein NFI96_013775 [Prochilodus magdalenae]|nr:hypothetical protein NFI96_013775 [Prochilodus magdalenae]
MYSRAPRVTELSSRGSTSSAVGPGAYQSINNNNNNKQDSYAPFLSLSGRLSVFDSASGISPGPGHYDVGVVRVRSCSVNTGSEFTVLRLCNDSGVQQEVTKGAAPVPGGQSLQNRSRRFEESESDVPGPGAYNITQTPGHKPNPASLKGSERTSKVWITDTNPHLTVTLQGVRLLFHSEAPSIPSPGQAFGYEENQHGTLCRHNPPTSDHTLGPAYYSPAQTEQRFKGVAFSRMTEKRAELKVVEGPGPGHYCPDDVCVCVDHSVYYENVNMRRDMSSRAELQVPRYHQLLTLQEEKKGVPGPGQYDLKGQFEKYTDPPAASRPPFLSQTPATKQVAPPVGWYSDPRCALESLKKPGGVKRSPFSHTAARFTPENRKSTTPVCVCVLVCPGAYDVFELGLAHDSQRKAHLESRRKGGFGCSAERTLQFINKEQPSPGPSHYTVRVEVLVVLVLVVLVLVVLVLVVLVLVVLLLVVLVLLLVVLVLVVLVLVVLVLLLLVLVLTVLVFVLVVLVLVVLVLMVLVLVLVVLVLVVLVLLLLVLVLTVLVFVLVVLVLVVLVLMVLVFVLVVLVLVVLVLVVLVLLLLVLVLLLVVLVLVVLVLVLAVLVLVVLVLVVLVFVLVVLVLVVLVLCLVLVVLLLVVLVLLLVVLVLVLVVLVLVVLVLVLVVLVLMVVVVFVLVVLLLLVVVLVLVLVVLLLVLLVLVVMVLVLLVLVLVVLVLVLVVLLLVVLVLLLVVLVLVLLVLVVLVLLLLRPDSYNVQECVFEKPHEKVRGQRQQMVNSRTDRSTQTATTSFLSSAPRGSAFLHKIITMPGHYHYDVHLHKQFQR